jgi:hypothetical protein
MRDDGSFIELSAVSKLVKAITGRFLGDERFFFPKQMLKTNPPFCRKFQKYLKNDWLIDPASQV